jgi:hypothetical protein
VLGLVFWVLRGRSLADLSDALLRPILALYVLGGLALGGIAGLLQPVITTWPRAVAVYAFAALPLAIGANGVFFSHRGPEDAVRRVLVIVFFLGLISGTHYWNRTTPPALSVD